MGAELREHRGDECRGDLEPAVEYAQDGRWWGSTRRERRGGGGAAGGVAVGGGRGIARDAKGLGFGFGGMLGTLGHETPGYKEGTGTRCAAGESVTA